MCCVGWAERGGTELTDVAVPGAAAALRPLAPVHGVAACDGAGGMQVAWVRRSRTDTGWRDAIDLPLGEGREAWRVTAEPPVAGIGPWECPAASLHLGAAEVAALPSGTGLAVRQVGDFALSPPLLIPLD